MIGTIIFVILIIVIVLLVLKKFRDTDDDDSYYRGGLSNSLNRIKSNMNDCCIKKIFRGFR